jgi:site-specific DNA recombinase
MANTRGYVALICRISEDKSGRVEGVRNQERWGRAYAGRTWPGIPVQVFADNDLSASDDTMRPEFERFRECLARGEVAHVWAVEQSRLERREAEWFRLAAELDAAGIVEVHTTRDGIVRVRDEVAGIKAVLNAAEVRKLKQRVNDTLDANAAHGRPAGSRPFGYAHGVDEHGGKTLVVVEAEAEVIRESADRLLVGWSLTNIARDLQRRGVAGPFQVKVTASGRRYTRRSAEADPVLTEDGTPLEDGGVAVTRPGRITMNSVRSWLTSPTVAGMRVHRGVIVGAGNWPAILDQDTFAAVRRKLTAARMVLAHNGGTYPVPAPTRHSSSRRYLLSGGVAVCGVCGSPLIGTLKQRRKGALPVRSVPYYNCHPKAGGHGCVGVLAEPFEQEVVDTLLAELDNPVFVTAVTADDHADERRAVITELDALDGRRNELAQTWAAGELTRDEWAAARAGLTEREQELRLALAQTPPPVAGIDLGMLRGAWASMTLDERREIIGLFVEHVVVNRATPGLHAFDPGRVDIVWRTR